MTDEAKTIAEIPARHNEDQRYYDMEHERVGEALKRLLEDQAKSPAEKAGEKLALACLSAFRRAGIAPRREGSGI